MPYHIVVGDIVRMKTDAVVNAANSGLHPGSGVCGAIFRAAGYAQLEEACRKIGRCPVGEAVITPGFRLSARYVIHAVGPVWEGGSRGEAELLRSAYISALTLAAEYGLASVAFPLISTGVYGYPKKEAMRIAEESINDFLSSSGKAMDVYTVIFEGNSAGVLPEQKTLGGCGCTN